MDYTVQALCLIASGLFWAAVFGLTLLVGRRR